MGLALQDRHPLALLIGQRRHGREHRVLQGSADLRFFGRPLVGWARYATPIDGLYLCGSGTHPGGGVMGASGHNAAATVLRQMEVQGIPSPA